MQPASNLIWTSPNQRRCDDQEYISTTAFQHDRYPIKEAVRSGAVTVSVGTTKINRFSDKYLNLQLENIWWHNIMQILCWVLLFPIHSYLLPVFPVQFLDYSFVNFSLSVDTALWNALFPRLDTTLTIASLRKKIYVN
jgi:hypothetical protein